ncbi:MAG: hypothetical protein K5765_06045 [Clostridia bacterium]|nr:hypothetical protein [Clostridia bacterium]
MLKERLKELDIKITELANYLSISRPTLYKYIEDYEVSNLEDINKSIIKLFDYITKNELIGKNNIINYILTNLTNVKELEKKEEKSMFKFVRNYMINNPDSNKSQFYVLTSKKDVFSNVIDYLMEIAPIINKKKLSEEEIELLKPYKELLRSIKEKEDL